MKLRNVAVAAAAISTLALTPVSGIAQPAPQAGIAQGAVQQPAAENTIPAGTVSEEILPAEFDDESWRQVIAEKGNRVQEVTVYSPSMDRKIPVVTIKADESAGPRPTLYLLNGAGGGEQSANWIAQTDVVDFYLEKNINVVIPMRGAFSYYTDWNETPTGSKYLQGPQKWETFLINVFLDQSRITWAQTVSVALLACRCLPPARFCWPLTTQACSTPPARSRVVLKPTPLLDVLLLG